MKNNKIYLVGFILLLYFNFVLQGTNISINEQDDKDVVTPLIVSNSVGYEWFRTWGGDSGEVGRSIAIDSNNNVIVVGTESSFGAGNADIVVVKYNNDGIQLWNRTWGGVDWDYGEGVVVDSPSNIYVAGTTRSFGAGHFDIVLVKFVVSERPPSDTVVMIIIIIMSIIAVASAVGVGIAITFFIRKRRNIV